MHQSAPGIFFLMDRLQLRTWVQLNVISSETYRIYAPFHFAWGEREVVSINFTGAGVDLGFSEGGELSSHRRPNCTCTVNCEKYIHTNHCIQLISWAVITICITPNLHTVLLGVCMHYGMCVSRFGYDGF